MTQHVNHRGFSLIELVIVVVIIAIIGAIMIPRMSRGAAGAADSALIGDLCVLRSAIDLYQTEHGGTFPTASDVVDQLTKYTDDSGATSDTRTGNYVYGPYLRKIPPVPVGARKGGTLVGTSDGVHVGWIYDATEGTIRPNTTTEADARGTLYRDY